MICLASSNQCLYKVDTFPAMFQPISLFIGLRYSRSKSHTGFISFITFFSTVGILLGVASLITVSSVMNGFEGELKKRILGIVPHVVVTKPYNRMQEEHTWSDSQKVLASLPGVKRVTPFLEAEVLVQSSASLKGVLLQGIKPQLEAEGIINAHMVAGSLSSIQNKDYSVIIGRSLANQLQVNLGDDLRIVLPNKTVFTPMGRVPVQRIFTITGIFNVGSQVDDTMVYIHSRDGAKLLRRKGDGIDKLRLYLDDAFNAPSISTQLTKLKDNNQLDKDITWQTWSQSQGALFSAVNMEKNMMWLMLSLIVAVAAFNIVSALVMVVIEKQGEIGILQTLGLTRLGIVKVFITQGMVNGLWGVFLGSIIGVLLTLNLNALLSVLGVSLLGVGVQVLPVQLEISDVVTIVVSALLMSFVATLYPAYRASTTQPAEVLRNE